MIEDADLSDLSMNSNFETRVRSRKTFGQFFWASKQHDEVAIYKEMLGED